MDIFSTTFTHAFPPAQPAPSPRETSTRSSIARRRAIGKASTVSQNPSRRAGDYGVLWSHWSMRGACCCMTRLLIMEGSDRATQMDESQSESQSPGILRRLGLVLRGVQHLDRCSKCWGHRECGRSMHRREMSRSVDVLGTVAIRECTYPAD